MFFLLIIVSHFLADFVCQSHWMATNKSTLWSALGLHALVYSVVMTICLLGICFSGFFGSIGTGPEFTESMMVIGFFVPIFFAITLVTHFLTDAVTSRITSYLWKQGRTHDFFVVVGADQVIHYWTLYFTLRLIGFATIN